MSRLKAKKFRVADREEGWRLSRKSQELTGFLTCGKS